MSDNVSEDEAVGKHRAWFADEVGEFPGDVPLEPLDKMAASLGGTFPAQKEAFEHLERAFSTMLEALEQAVLAVERHIYLGEKIGINSLGKINTAIAKAKGLDQ